MAMLLKDKITLVTGAGRGLGQAVAIAYARQGAQVIAVARTQSELDRTAELIHAEGGRVLTMSLDISHEEAVRYMAERTWQEFGRLDVLVNNAGRLPLKAFAEMTVADWDRTLAVNLRGPFLACKFFLESMKANGRGSIINVSSNAGVKGFALETDYCASKFGLEGFSQALALELQPDNIAVNILNLAKLDSPLRIKPTSVTQTQYDSLSDAERAQWHNPMLLTEAFIFLALQDGRGITGERIYAYELSEQIRREGWDFKYEPSL
jgi:NAD(P)-dependent dehydrogenase (short-subunit alcohol dehydrogenase family)